MNGFEYIFTKQVQWAKNNGIPLEGSQGKRGRLAYTKELEANLFEPLTPSVKSSFEEGDGGELKNKMRAVHSSSALGVNIFQYWLTARKIPFIARTCGLSEKESRSAGDIQFEYKARIHADFTKSPNIDVVIVKTSGELLAVECKFTEAYSSQKHGGLKEKYLEHRDLWKNMPNLREFAKSICPEDSRFHHLHPAQLVKHILGLTQTVGAARFKLLYLWCDVLGPEGAKHAQEIEAFKAVTQKDGISFDALSYQELIVSLCNNCGPEHEEYIRYISERYL